MATQSANVTAQPRSELGSRANKRLRDKGLLPGVIYGHKEAVVPVTLPKKEVVKYLDKGAHVFDIALDGKSEKVLVKEVQYDHLGAEVLHVDFARVSLDERVEVTVPLELKGEPKGEADGGVLQQVVSELELECLVTEIPDAIRHNVSEMALGDVLQIKDLKLPAGIKALQDDDLIVATVKEIVEEAPAEAPEGSAEPEVIGRKPEEGEEGAAGEESK
ncbi:MAG TPA: 50S ribosomal protein L25 [Tepidisphaeraceae bacterium]|nr:50S ribosomal protein L25 [Tepidisphaeraceae bacterium]